MNEYYLPFLPHCSNTTAPLDFCLPAAASQLKSLRTFPLVLAHFDLQSPMFVTYDTSNAAGGVVLPQLQ